MNQLLAYFKPLSLSRAIPLLLAVIGLGYLTLHILAAGPAAEFLLSGATITGNASLAANASALGGSMLVFGTAPTPSPTAVPTPTPTATPTPTPTPGGCAAGVTGAAPACQTAPPATAASGKHWNVSFFEEFNGTDYDHTKLTPCFDWNYGDCTSTFNNGREHYLPSQVTVSNGTAKLNASPLSPPYASSACQNSSCTHKAGLLSTARKSGNDPDTAYLYKFTYGYVESRFKFPATQGFFTAFWMLPADTSYQYQTEIDILELLGYDPKQMWMTYNYGPNRSLSYEPNTGIGNNGACAYQDYSTGFVRMGVDWEPDHIAWYINGVKCGQFTDAAQIGNQPMQLILHMMIDNNWERSWNEGLVDATLSRDLEVDYIRVYQQTP
ncbi:MAG TPA: glycoside hydrolase family 16 protein [Candidatus Saccharimonas sp.]|nr:glycoside hydrolase family 16 protein [Candidatus Saccharimonas sp.]